MDTYRGFTLGQRNKDPDKGQGMSEYLDDWENKWKKMSNSKDNESMPALLCGFPNGGVAEFDREPKALIEPGRHFYISGTSPDDDRTIGVSVEFFIRRFF